MDLCTELRPILRIVGYVILGIKIAVPIILIIVGMVELAKAVTEQDDKKIKEAQSKLVKKAILAAIVFLVGFIVSVIMTLVGGNDYKNAKCIQCLNHPGDCGDPIEEFVPYE